MTLFFVNCFEFLDIKEEDKQEDSFKKGEHFATLASKWCRQYQGFPISQLPLYSLTTSEILRLHFLTSGSKINDRGTSWRYYNRGGYNNKDDPGLYLCIHYPHILKCLAVHNVIQLPIGDKVKVLMCLVNQLLTYADIRDWAEDKLEEIKKAKLELRSVQVAERKRHQEFITNKAKLERDENVKNLKEELERLERISGNKQYENEKKIEELSKIVNNNVLLGYVNLQKI